MTSRIVEEYGDERAAEALKQGIQQGEQQKAVEAAVTIIRKYKASPEDAAKDVGAPLDKLLDALK